MATANTILNELLDPVGRCLTPEVARQLVKLRAPPPVQSRIEELAARCTQGRLSAEEREEYEAYVSAGNFIGVLQSKARKLLQTTTDC